MFYLRDDDRLVICNVRPPRERVNPWVLNVRAYPDVTLEVAGRTLQARAREATAVELTQCWPRLVAGRAWSPCGQRTKTSARPAGNVQCSSWRTFSNRRRVEPLSGGRLSTKLPGRDLLLSRRAVWHCLQLSGWIMLWRCRSS